MDRRPLRIRLQPRQRARAVPYRVAGIDVLCDRPVADLEAFETFGTGSRALLAPRRLTTANADGSGLVFDGEGWVGGRQLAVSCHQSSEGYLVRVAGAARFLIGRDGTEILHLGDAGASGSLVLHSVLGPCLCLALALRGTFCMHASASTRGSEAVMFLGASGSGKSTLARFFDAGSRLPWHRASDDILPLKNEGEEVMACPDFPQLKLPGAEQWGGGVRPKRLQVRAIYRLVPAPSDAAVTMEPLASRDAVVALLRHTVAARLFGKTHRETHLDFCAWIAGRVPVADLWVPRRLDRLEEVAAVIDTALARARREDWRNRPLS